MQSAAPHVLALLDRRHTPGRAAEAAREARAAGFDHVNLDLIYGTPGETADDFAASLSAGDRRRGRPRLGVLADRRGRHPAGRPGAPRRAARARRRRRRGPVPGRRRGAVHGRAGLVRGVQLGPARRPLPAQPAVLARRGLVGSGRARTATWAACGGGTSNIRHAYGQRLADDRVPAQARELLSEAERHTEDVMLGLRLADGLPVSSLPPTDDLVAEGLLERRDDRVVRPGAVACC